MPRTLNRLFACCLMLHFLWPAGVRAQPTTEGGTTQAAAEQSFNTEQLDALVAPIALYPDSLLTQILMASTFPLEVVQAARWVEDPANKALTGDALTKTLEGQTWDPSVKSLVPFPQVLAMMNGNLDWMQQLGYAFADQQAAVFDSVQRLRRQAQTNGNLQSSPQQVVRTEQQTIVIEPAQPNVVYVPSYNPTAVYGAWPYPSYPPVYLPPPVAYPVGTALATGLAFGAGVAITAGLWNWARPAWGSGSVNVNVNRYNSINANRAAIHSSTWQANRAGGRPAGMARPPGGPVGRPARSGGLPAGAIGRQQVSVPGGAVRSPVAGNRQQLAGGAGRPNAPGGAGSRPGLGQPGSRPSQGTRPNASGPAANRPSQGAFSGMNEGRQASQFGQRGGQSRSAGQMHRPSGGAAAGRGGGERGGGGRR